MLRALPVLLVLAACGTLEPGAPETSSSGAPADGGAAGSPTPDGSSPADGGAVDGSTSPIPDGQTCVVGQGPPCGPASYCDSRSCAVGTCVAKGAAPVNFQFAPVCGCDGITYWSIYDSMYAGVSYAQSGECVKGAKTTKSCKLGGVPCPTGTFCGVLTISTVCTESAGKCWKLPDTCPSGTGTGTPMETCGNKCVGYCEAIRAESAFYYDAQKCPAP